MITRLYVRVRTMLSDAEGASAVEYGLLVAGIAAVVIIGVIALGGTVNTTFGEVNTSISGL